MKNTKVYGVILAGGQSSRLWPLSRKHKSKGLLSYAPDESLLAQTVARVDSLIPMKQLWAITTDDQLDLVQEELGDKVDNIIVEPDSRNTAAAMTLSCLLIQRIDPEAVIVFLPTDHYIPQQHVFTDFLEHAIDYASNHERITLLGLKATYCATDYGYIAYDHKSSFPAPVKFFHEKPDMDLCAHYVQEGLLWNSGILVSQAGVFLDICREVAPEVFDSVFAYVSGSDDYYAVPTISVDKAILEKTDCCSVLPADFIWCDVGSLETFLALKDQISGQKNIVTIDAHDNLVEVENSLVALVGVSNVCVVQNDDVLLVVNRDQVDKVKLVLEVLKQQQDEEYL